MNAGKQAITLVAALLTAAATAAGPHAADNPAAGRGAAAGDATSARDASRPAGPQSPAREGVASDFKDGRQNCNDLAGSEREACVARAAATAESPRGREGANPTGKSKPARGVGETAR